MNKAFITGLLTALAAVIVSFFQTNGFPINVIGWEILAITILGNLIIYLGKNALFPSTSLLGKWNSRDIMSGIVLAVGNGIVAFAAAGITDTAIDWKLLWATSLSVAGTYLMTKLGFGPKKTV